MKQILNVIGPDLQKLPGATFDAGIETLLNQIDEGLRADDATNFEKLTIARKYGPLLIQLKTIVPHGQFKLVLKERFPRVSYSKCNRWMFIAKHESDVEAALIDHPDEAWGPKKMIDYLRGVWTPGNEQFEEDDCYGVTPDNRNEPDDEPYYSEIEEEDLDGTDDSDEAEPNENESIGPTTQHSDAALKVSDPRSEDDGRPQWEAFAANAEAEAKLTGKDPVVPSSDGILTVTVFSKDDHALIEGCLSKWEPSSVPVYGKKDTHHVTATVKPKQIPDLLLQLGKTLKQTLPCQLKVVIEL